MSTAEQKKRVKEKVRCKAADESPENNADKDGALSTDTRIHCLSIIGQIEGHYLLPEGQKATKYEHIIPELVEIEELSKALEKNEKSADEPEIKMVKAPDVDFMW